MSQPTTSIEYDRITHDYAMTVNGEYVGSAPSYPAAELILNQLTTRLAVAAQAEDRNTKVLQLSTEYKTLKAQAEAAQAAGFDLEADTLMAQAQAKKAEGLAILATLPQGE